MLRAGFMTQRVSSIGRCLAAMLALGVALCGAAGAEAPPQRLPSAVLIYPLVVVEGGGAVTDTRIELVNLTQRPVQLKCLYVPAGSCSGLNFQVQLTPNQPLSWLASRGLFSHALTAVPPFFQTGELKCIVQPDDVGLDRHNAIQGRAAVFGADGQTIGYSAVGFLRLVEGPYTSLISLDGATYSQCPDEQHFVFQSSVALQPDTETEIVLAPCSEDLENLVAPPTTVQFVVVNEFEQQLSASTTVSCYARRPLRQISTAFTRATLGTETGHIIVRGVQTPVLAMLVDRFRTPNGAAGTAGNEPALRGGRPGEIRLP